MQAVLDTIGGIWQLLGLGLRGGLKPGSAYWQWRRETAFGSDPDAMPPRRERWRAMLDYGRWVHRMKHGR
jgi:hypothetical protein